MPPPINQALVASVGIAAATVVVAAAVAIYQDPEVRRRTDELRRRIAIALRSLGDNVDPNAQPRFNRPEDAHGFYESHTVDADDETRRRQREELMYWNALRESQQLNRQPTSPHGSTFEDFLQPDSTGERGTLVYNTGANAWDDSNNNMVRRRGGNTEGVRGLNASMIANPFNDEYGIELDEQPRIDVLNLLAPGQDEVMSDIYNASPVLRSATPAQPPPPMTPLSNGAADPNVLFDFDSQSETVDSRTEYDTAMDAELNDGARTPTTARSVTLDREFAEDEYMTTSNDDEEDERNAAYASIQAWAQNSTSGFYSPLPVTPAAPLSEAEFISEGHLTPTDSASVVDVGYDAASSRGGDYDVLSDSDDGIATPGSWSEVGSIISESESALRA